MPLKHPTKRGPSYTSKDAVNFNPRTYYKSAQYQKNKTAPKSKAQFKKEVLKVLHQQNETKEAWHTLTTTDFNSGINLQSDCIRIIPNISQGDADNNRTGDEIKPMVLTIRGITQMLPQNIGQSDGVRKIGVRMMIVTPKSYNTWASAYANATTWQAYLLKKGGTTTSFSGAIDDLFAPVNTDAITCHYNKVFYLNQNTYGQSTATGLVAFDQSNLVRFWKKSFKFGASRKFKYDASVDSGLTPSNGPAYVFLMGYCFVDGTSPDIVSTRVRGQFDVTLKYEDD